MKRKAIAVIGLGQFGSTVATMLSDLGHEVLGVDINTEIVQRMSATLTHVVVADTTDEHALQSLSLNQFDVIIIAIGDNTQANLMTAMLLKDMGMLYIVAKAESTMQGRMLQKIGVDAVVYPERDMAMRLAQSLTRDHVIDYLQLSDEIGLIELETPKFLVGKTLMDSGLREDYHLSVVAVKTGGHMQVPPVPSQPLRIDDKLLIIGHTNDLDRLESRKK